MVAAIATDWALSLLARPATKLVRRAPPPAWPSPADRTVGRDAVSVVREAGERQGG